MFFNEYFAFVFSTARKLLFMHTNTSRHKPILVIALIKLFLVIVELTHFNQIDSINLKTYFVVKLLPKPNTDQSV